MTFADASAPVTSASFSEPGTYTLRLTASDTRFNVEDEVSIVVLPANLAPSADAGPDQAVALGANLLRNGGNESELVENEIRNWTEAAGNSWTRAGAALPASAEGATSFYAGEVETAELRQDVGVSAFAADIAAGL